MVLARKRKKREREIRKNQNKRKNRKDISSHLIFQILPEQCKTLSSAKADHGMQKKKREKEKSARTIMMLSLLGKIRPFDQSTLYRMFR